MKGLTVGVRDVSGRIVGKARVGNYYPGTQKYHIEFLYPTGETEEIDVPGWCLVMSEEMKSMEAVKKKKPTPVFRKGLEIVIR